MGIEVNFHFINKIVTPATAIGIFAVTYPGGEIIVNHFPEGYVEVQSALVLDYYSADPRPSSARRSQTESITVPSSAVVAAVFG